MGVDAPCSGLWRKADWQYARDAIELTVAAFADGEVKVSVLGGTAAREKRSWAQHGRRGRTCRIRYTEPSSSPTASVSKPDGYRDL